MYWKQKNVENQSLFIVYKNISMKFVAFFYNIINSWYFLIVINDNNNKFFFPKYSEENYFKYSSREEGCHRVRNVDRCSLLLRILKVYRTGIHSGYIQYTYRGFHIPHQKRRRRRSAPHVATASGYCPSMKNLEVRLTLHVVVHFSI